MICDKYVHALNALDRTGEDADAWARYFAGVEAVRTEFFIALRAEYLPGFMTAEQENDFSAVVGRGWEMNLASAEKRYARLAELLLSLTTPTPVPVATDEVVVKRTDVEWAVTYLDPRRVNPGGIVATRLLRSCQNGEKNV